MTAGVWFKRNGNPSATEIIFGRDELTNKRCWVIYMDTSGNILVDIYQTGNTTTYKRLTSTLLYTDNDWHHFGFTYDTNTFKIYRDGVEDTDPIIGSNDPMTNIFATDIGIQIGCLLQNGVRSFFFEGSDR